MASQNKFMKIYEELAQAIDEKKYRVGEPLRSENDLAEQYNVSRETVRKALRRLRETGYIQKQQGKGSIVLDQTRFDFPVSGLTSFKELMTVKAKATTTKVIRNEEQVLPLEISKRLGMRSDTPVIHLTRVRFIDDEAVIIDDDYLAKEFVAEMPTKRAEDSIYDYMEKDLGLTIDFAHKQYTVEPVTLEDQQLLDLHGDTHVVVVRSDVHLENTAFIQYTISRHRLDKFRFVDFARRQNK
ncbi:trehalose operon repressor [Brochothrix campestris]|uniref:Trehalose operon repressor n=1 Tax=Brochothrix campestris FSL F6-1037 TaxID=1265861 RepID=W7CTG9_9LIST|nr:trehalose operon repressor [Brochothrix campestris]EUJ39990.1 GntR family transcriptional regulator [Brochothrix campestris FSL F6-1037]